MFTGKVTNDVPFWVHPATLTEEIFEKVKDVKMMTKEELERHRNKKIVIAESGEDIISVAFILDLNDPEHDNITKTYEFFIETYGEENLAKDSMTIATGGITLLGLESFVDGTYAGTAIIEELMATYPLILLDSANIAVSYWDKHPFFTRYFEFFYAFPL